MSLAEWLAAGADPAKMSAEEVRRQQNLLAVREEQAAARLESLIEDRDSLFRRGAQSRSPVLRRVLARRHARVDADVRAGERELARIGKEVAGLAAIRRLVRDGTTLAPPGDVTPLLTLLDDASASEEEFAETLSMSLRADRIAEPRTGPVALDETDVLGVWERLDRGEFESVDEARRHVERR